MKVPRHDGLLATLALNLNKFSKSSKQPVAWSDGLNLSQQKNV